MKYYRLSILLLLLMVVFLLFKYDKASKGNAFQIEAQALKAFDYMEVLEGLQNKIVIEHAARHQKVSNIILNKFSQDSIKLSELFDNKESILILIQPQFGCADCFGESVQAIKEILDSSLTTSVYFLVSLDNMVDFNYYKELYDLDEEFLYNTDPGFLKNTDINSNTNCFVILTNDLVIKELFIPDINNKPAIEAFLKSFVRISNEK